MRPLEDEALTEPDPRRGRKVFGQIIYVTAFERRTHARPTRVETILPERIEVKIRPQEKYRGLPRCSRSRSIPELCRITLKPTGDQGIDQTSDDELFIVQKQRDKEPGDKPKEVYISQYTHCFEGKIEKPHIAAWKQDFEPCHVAHSDSKFCVLNTPVGSKSRVRRERPKSAPPGSFLFDFGEIDIQEPLSRRSTSPGMFIGDSMGIDETDYKPRMQAEEIVTAQSVVPYESLSSSLWDDTFDDIKEESGNDVTQDDVTQDPMQQARSLISDLRSSVKTPDEFRKTHPHPVYTLQAINQSPEKELQEHPARSKAPTDKASQRPLPQIKPKPKRVSQEFLSRNQPTTDKASRGSLPWIKPTWEKVPQVSLPWFQKQVPEVEKHSESTTARTRPEKATTKPTQGIKKGVKEKGLNERLWDLIGDLEPNDRISAFKTPQVTQEIKTNHHPPSTPANSWKAVEVMSSPVSPPLETRIDQSGGRVLREKAANDVNTSPFMTSPASCAIQPKIDQSDDRGVGEKGGNDVVTPPFMTSPVSSQPKINQSDGRVVYEKPKQEMTPVKKKFQVFDDVSNVQKPEIEVANRRNENQSRKPKNSKDEENSQPSDIHSKVTSLSNSSRARNSSISSEASYKKRLTGAWIEQQRLNIHRNTADNKEQRLRRTKSADLTNEGFKIEEEGSEVKLKHSKSELNFEQLKAMYDPFSSDGPHKARAVHTTEPTVITKARSVEHKLHKIIYAKNPVEAETLTRGSEEVLNNEAPLTKSEELPKIMKLQAVYSEKTPSGQAKLKDRNEPKTEPQILPPKATSQSETSASPSTRIKAKHIEGKKVVSNFSGDSPKKIISSVVSVTANEIEGAKHPVVQGNVTRRSMPENKPRESVKPELNTTEQKPSLNGGPHYIKVRSKENKNPIEKLTARFLKGKETTKVRHIVSPKDHLDRDDNNNRPKSPGDTPLGSPTGEKNGDRKSKAGKKGAAFLSALKNVKIRKAKSESNLEKEPEDFKDGGEREGKSTRVVVREKRFRHPLGSTPNLSPTDENGREVNEDKPNTPSKHTFEDTPQEKRPKKGLKSGLPALNISMYPKFKKFKNKLRKSNQHNSDNTDVSETGNSGSYSTREIGRSDQSTASFVSTGSEHIRTVNEDQIDTTEMENDVFVLNGGEISPSNDNGTIELSPRIRNSVPFEGEKQQSTAKVTKVKVISRETTPQNEVNKKNGKTDSFTPTVSSASLNSERGHNNVKNQKWPTSTASNTNVSLVPGKTWPRGEKGGESKESGIVSAVVTSKREIPELNNVQRETKESKNTSSLALKDRQFHKGARNKKINRLSMPEMFSSQNDVELTQADKLRRATVIGSAIDVTRISETQELAEDEQNKDEKNGLIRAKVYTANTALENSKNKDDVTPKKISRKKEDGEKKEFGKKIKGFMSKVSPFNHRGKINPQKEFTGISNETKEKADDTNKERLEKHPFQETQKRKQGEVLKAKTFVLQPKVKVTSIVASESEKLRKDSAATGSETTAPKAKHLPQLATVKSIVEREQASKFERTRQNGERESSSGLAGNDDDDVTRSNNVTRPRKLVATVTVEPVIRTTIAGDHGKERRISKAPVSEDLESIDRAFDFLSSAFGDGSDSTRNKTMATTESAITKAQISEDLESFEAAFDLLSSAFNEDEATRQKSRVEGGRYERGYEGTSRNIDSQKRNEGTTVVPENARILNNKTDTKIKENGADDKKESYNHIKIFTTDKRETIEDHSEQQKNIESDSSAQRNSRTSGTSLNQNLYYGKIKGTTINEQRHQAIRVQTVPSAKSEQSKTPRSINLERETTTVKSTSLVESREENQNVDIRGSRRGVAPFQMKHDENGEKRQLQYVEKVTITRSTMASDVRRESRGKKETGTILPEDRDKVRSGDKFPEVKLKQSEFLGDGNNTKQRVNGGGSANWSQTRSGDKSPEVKLERSDFLESADTEKPVNVGESAGWSQVHSGDKFPGVQMSSKIPSGEKSPGLKLTNSYFSEDANTKDQVNMGGIEESSQTRTGDKSPGMKLDWDDDENKEDLDLENDSLSSDSIKANSDDELLKLIEDQIASEGSDNVDKSDDENDGDTTPVPENNPEIYSIPRNNSDTEHKTPNTPLGVVSTQKMEVDGTIAPKTRTEHTMKPRVDPTMNSRVDPTMNYRVDPTMKSRVDPTMKSRVDPTNDHADFPMNGHEKTDKDRYQVRTVSSSIQKATFSFVDMNVEEIRHSQIKSSDTSHKKDPLFNYTSYSARNSEVKQQQAGKFTTAAKRPKHFTKKKKQTSTDDLSTRLKRLLTDDSSGPDDSSLNQDMTSPIYSFSEDSEFDTQFSQSKATFSNTRMDQRQYRSLERPKRTTKDMRMSRISRVSPSEFSSDDEYYPNRSGFDFRLHSKTL